MTTMRKFRITGSRAHQGKPKKKIDFTREVEAYDALDAMRVYRRLKGVKRYGLLGVAEVSS